MCSLAVPRDAASSLNAEGGGPGVNALWGDWGGLNSTGFVSNDSAKAGKGRRGHPDTPAAVRDLALLALDLSFPIWKMGLTVQGEDGESDFMKRPDGC